MAVKYLVLILVVALVLWLSLGRRPRVREDKPARKSRRDVAEPMAVCAHCGVHLPRSEALRRGEHWYCSAAHRDAGPRADA